MWGTGALCSEGVGACQSCRILRLLEVREQALGSCLIAVGQAGHVCREMHFFPYIQSFPADHHRQGPLDPLTGALSAPKLFLGVDDALYGKNFLFFTDGPSVRFSRRSLDRP